MSKGLSSTHSTPGPASLSRVSRLPLPETTQWWAPMAWAIFWGLLFNTMLVLIAIPTFYYTWENWRAKAKAKN